MGKVNGNVNDVFACYRGRKPGEDPRHMIVLPDKKVRELDPSEIQDPKIAEQVKQRNSLENWDDYQEVAKDPSSSNPPSTNPSPPSPQLPSGWTEADGETMNQLLNKSGQFRYGRDDLEQIAGGKWDKYPESQGSLTDDEINSAKKLIDKDAELMKNLDIFKGRMQGSDEWEEGSDGYLLSHEIAPKVPV